MGWLPVLLSGIAAFLLHRTNHPVLAVLAAIAAAGCFWSWGVMHNYATELAKRRPGYTGGFYDITDREADAVPDWIAWTAAAFALVGLILLIVGLISVIRQR
jgi:hypothetical protein